MLDRLQFLLIVLLFALTGNLARHHAGAQSVPNADCAVFSQHTAPQNQIADLLLSHSFFAPEAMSDSQSETAGSKAPAVTTLFPGYHTAAIAQQVGFPAHKPVHPHPRPTEYYIFSLEKILI